MPRPALSVLLLSAVLAAGCGGATFIPSSVPPAASAQRATLGWVESAGSPTSRLVFRVRSFTVKPGGWAADISFTNDTSATFSIEHANDVLDEGLGIMLFDSGSHGELERRNTQQALPVLRRAATFTPTLPASLAPHATWSGTASARGALPAGLWVRFVFGTFVPRKEMPDSLKREGVRDFLIWITDHAHQLKS